MHPTIASSVSPFSSRPQSFPASGSFPMSWLFSSGGESIGASASVSVLPMDIQGWFPLGSPCCPRDSLESSPAPQYLLFTEYLLCARPFIYINSANPHLWRMRTLRLRQAEWLAYHSLEPHRAHSKGEETSSMVEVENEGGWAERRLQKTAGSPRCTRSSLL